LATLYSTYIVDYCDVTITCTLADGVSIGAMLCVYPDAVATAPTTDFYKSEEKPWAISKTAPLFKSTRIRARYSMSKIYRLKRSEYINDAAYRQVFTSDSGLLPIYLNMVYKQLDNSNNNSAIANIQMNMHFAVKCCNPITQSSS